MLVILSNSSFQLARCMLYFRDTGIKKQPRTPILSYYLQVWKKILFVILAMISIS